MFHQALNRWNMLPILAKIVSIVVVGVVAFLIWAYSPSLYNRTVSEPFPTTAPAMAEKPTAAPAMAEKPTAAPAMAEKPTAAPAMAEKPTAAPAMAEEPTATPAMAESPTATLAQPTALLKGSFIAGSTAGDQAEGTATIYTLEDGKRILRLEHFRTSNGPDLVVALYTGANPEKDAGKYFTLEGIKGNQGDQNYELPADVDIHAYRSVVIWCRTFNVVFGYATLAS